MKAQRLYLQRFTDRLPICAPWLCSHSSSAIRTDIFVIDPAWDAELSRIGALIHRCAATTLDRCGAGFGQLRFTVLLGDDAMNLQLHRRAWGYPDKAAMLCFAEFPRRSILNRRRITSLGVVALAHEELQREADKRAISIDRRVGRAVIEGSLVLLDHPDGPARSELAMAIEMDVGFGSDDPSCSLTGPGFEAA